MRLMAASNPDAEREGTVAAWIHIPTCPVECAAVAKMAEPALSRERSAAATARGWRRRMNERFEWGFARKEVDASEDW